MVKLDKQTVQASWRRQDPVITWIIVAVCVVVWLIEICLRYLAPGWFVLFVGNGMFVAGAAVIHPWTWLTSMFLHAPSVLHVLFNMMALYVVGPPLERLLGHWRFLALYLISGLGGALGIVVWGSVTGNWFMAAYGASGALFGLFAALLVVYRRIGADIRSMLIWMAINFAMPIVIPSIAWQAHVGGFIVGGTIAWLLSARIPWLRKQSLSGRMWIVGGSVTVILICAGVLLVP